MGNKKGLKGLFHLCKFQFSSVHSCSPVSTVGGVQLQVRQKENGLRQCWAGEGHWDCQCWAGEALEDCAIKEAAGRRDVGVVTPLWEADNAYSFWVKFTT